jgi:hypothetical protein
MSTFSRTQHAFAGRASNHVKLVASFNDRPNKQCKIDALEMKIRGEILTHLNGGFFNLLLANSAFMDDLIRAKLMDLPVFFEVNGLANQRTNVMQTIHALGNSYNKRKMGFKFRCGGVEAAAFPSPDVIASALLACRRAEIPIKFTAGLHHPIRHFDKTMQIHMNGFINVLVAGVIAYTGRLDEDQLTSVIADEDPQNFRLGETGLSWKDHFVSLEQISDARQNAALTFGSCSFDEPRDDLRKLGWLL